MWISVAAPDSVKGSLPISTQEKVDPLKPRNRKASGLLKLGIWGRAGNGRSELGSSASVRSAMQRQNGRCLGAGCWMNILWKLKAEWKRMVVNVARPAPVHRFQYDAVSYAQNFDDGFWHDDRDSLSASTLGSARESPPLGDCE